jgi:hypothetical protein
MCEEIHRRYKTDVDETEKSAGLDGSGLSEK